MFLLYSLVSLILVSTSFLLIFKPQLIKSIFLMLINNNLMMVYGVGEIAMALGILYFRNKANFSFIPLIIGVILFIDGIMYVVFSSKKERLLKAILQINNKTLKKFSLITIMAAIGLLFSSFTSL